MSQKDFLQKYSLLYKYAVSFTSNMNAGIYTLALQDILNFTFTLKRPPDGQWGSKKTDGSWTGMVNLLQTKQADIGLKDNHFM